MHNVEVGYISIRCRKIKTSNTSHSAASFSWWPCYRRPGSVGRYIGKEGREEGKGGQREERREGMARKEKGKRKEWVEGGRTAREGKRKGKTKEKEGEGSPRGIKRR